MLQFKQVWGGGGGRGGGGGNDTFYNARFYWVKVCLFLLGVTHTFVLLTDLPEL